MNNRKTLGIGRCECFWAMLVTAMVMMFAGYAHAQSTIVLYGIPADGSRGTIIAVINQTTSAIDSWDGTTTNTTIGGIVAGQILELHASPVGGFAFHHWAGTAVDNGLVADPTNPTTTLTASGAAPSFVTLYAVFGLPQYSLTMSNDGNALATVPTSGTTTTYDEGAAVSIATGANAGYAFKLWGSPITGSGTTHTAPANPFSSSTTVIMNADYNIRAYFSEQFDIVMQNASGPGSATITRQITDGAEYTAQVPNVIVSDTTTHRYLCSGWIDGSGDIPVAGTAVAYGPYNVSQNSAMDWQWDDHYRLQISTFGIGETSPTKSTNHWYTSTASVTLMASPSEGYVFGGWFEGATSLGQGSIILSMNVAHDIIARFVLATGDGDNDGLLDSWEVRFGIDPTDQTGDNGASGDPDGDGLTNYQEFLLQMTNSIAPFQYSNPSNADTDGDGMDDSYEYFSIDSNEQRSTDPDDRDISNVSAVLDPGSLSAINGPAGNRDGDSYWRTSDGFNNTNEVLPNIKEWRGPDNIAPCTYEIVAPGANASDGWNNSLSMNVNRAIANVTDTHDQSKGNSVDTDGDGFDDGFEHTWDIWQQANSGTNEMFQYGYSANDILTNAVPVWDGAANVTRRFNPHTIHVDATGTNGTPDGDVLYDYSTYGVSESWYSDSMEYSAWENNKFSPSYTNAPHTIVRIMHPTWKRSSHPFYIDIDQDGLPDGYEVIFGYDPWLAVSPGASTPDAEGNPDNDWMAWIDSNTFHRAVYNANGFDPRTAWAEFSPVADEMPGTGTGTSPLTKRYTNLDELYGADGKIELAPRPLIGISTDDATSAVLHDTDGDGMWDGWENYVGLDSHDPADAGLDPDGDGIGNLVEFGSFVTSSTNRDLLLPVEGWYNKIFPTDPFDADTDGDGIGDEEERQVFNGTNFGSLVWSGLCYGGGGLNPCSVDTDRDSLPDPWESCFSNVMNGTEGDQYRDADGDGLENYQEYITGAMHNWQYDFWAAGQPEYDRANMFWGIPKAWDWYAVQKNRPYMYIPYLGPGPGTLYSTTDPSDSDSDNDGMHDYYEVFHGLNPVYGIEDIVMARITGTASVPVGVFTGDLQTMPFVIGSPLMDPDGDGITNADEGLRQDSLPTHLTDPTPYWVTDTHYTGSHVNLYYRWPTNVWYWSDTDVATPPEYAFDFEMNGGYDTDGDNNPDYEEIVGGSTDPVSDESPIKRRALYLPAGLDAYARTQIGYHYKSEMLREFCVEAWVRPLNAVSGEQQVVFERPLVIPQGNPMNMNDGIRLNFRLAIDGDGRPYVAYNSSGVQYIYEEVKAKSPAVLLSNQWTHLAAVYQAYNGDTHGRLTLYVNGEVEEITISDMIPVNGYFGTGDYSYVLLAPLLIGASDENPEGYLDGSNSGVIPQPQPTKYFSGWIDEIRMWNGVRTQDEVQNDMKRRLKRDDINNGSTNGAYIVAMYTFDNRQDADYDGIVPEGFDTVISTITPPDWSKIEWWSEAADRSLVYSDYRCLPWLSDTASHNPLLPPIDIGNLNNSTSLSNVINRANPYTHWYTTAHDKMNESYVVQANLLPLRWAEIDEDVEMWDTDDSSTGRDPYDSDGDGLPDGWEEEYGLNPLNTNGFNGGDGDIDSDDLSNYYEYLSSCSPNQHDSDGNGVADINEDFDSDGLQNGLEQNLLSNPSSSDSDVDGIVDLMEVAAGSDLLDYASKSVVGIKDVMQPFNSISWNVGQNPLSIDVTYIVEFSSDMQEWTAVEDLTSDGNSFETLTITGITPPAKGGFYRLRLELR